MAKYDLHSEDGHIIGCSFCGREECPTVQHDHPDRTVTFNNPNERWYYCKLCWETSAGSIIGYRRENDQIAELLVQLAWKILDRIGGG